MRTALGCLVRDGIMQADNMEDAVRMAANKATSGYAVLFSPGCESDVFDPRKMEKVFIKMAKE